MLSIKNLKNVRFKKKLSYKFTKLFKILDVVEFQTYRFRFSKKIKNSFCFLCVSFKIVLREREYYEIKKHNVR